MLALLLLLLLANVLVLVVVGGGEEGEEGITASSILSTASALGVTDDVSWSFLAGTLCLLLNLVFLRVVRPLGLKRLLPREREAEAAAADEASSPSSSAKLDGVVVVVVWRAVVLRLLTILDLDLDLVDAVDGGLVEAETGLVEEAGVAVEGTTRALDLRRCLLLVTTSFLVVGAGVVDVGV